MRINASLPSNLKPLNLKEKILHKNQNIYFRTYGNNQKEAVFLVHGYLESGDIWIDFTVDLSNQYYVVCIDLPGHGDSESGSDVQTMEAMAMAIKSVADALHITKLYLVGHSLGGYVTMAFREMFPEMLKAYVLFHSTCYADSDEKKANRDREIELVMQGKKDLIINTNIPKAFADANLIRMETQLAMAKQIAFKTKDMGIISALNGMKIRADRSFLLVEGGIPLLLFAGKKDNYIPFEVMSGMKKMAKNSFLVILERSGHMGFIEEKRKSAKGLIAFFNSIK